MTDSAAPITTKIDLASAWKEVGIMNGADVMIHSSMRALGFVVNGALDVIDSLLEVIGEGGTLLAPAHTGQLTDPAEWKKPAIPAEYVETVRRCMLPFDPKTTPIRGRGVIPQVLMTYPGVCRSIHPLNSVIAKGSHAEYYTQVHSLHGSEGMESPIGRLYGRGGFVLLIGVTMARCTAIHLAEFIADVPYLKSTSMKVLVRGQDGNNEFVRLERYPGNSEHFDKVRRDLGGSGIIKENDFQCGRLIFFPIQPVVDFTVERLKENENYLIRP